MKRLITAIVVTATLGFSFLVPASGAVKAGASCTKLKATTTVSGYKFTCIKSGSKLVWSKGVKVAVKATPTPSATPTPATSSTVTVAEKDLPKQGDSCTLVGKKYPTTYGFIRCDWEGGYKNAWHEHHIPVLSNSKSNNYKVTPVAGQTCFQSGDTYDVASGYLECRFISGGKLAWMKINSVKNTFTNVLSPAGTEVCKLKNSDIDISKLPENTRGGIRDLSIAAGFPASPKNGWVNPGVSKALVVGVDFPELRGNDSDLKKTNAYDKKMMEEWFAYFSNGTKSYDLTTIDYWFHATKSAKSYSQDYSVDSRGADGNSIHDAVNQEMVDLITKDVDLTPFNTLYIIFPDGEITLDRDWITRNRPVKTKEGIKNINIFGWGKDNELMGTMHWAYYIHEVGHDAPWIGHAPGNGWPFGIMAQQSGISESLFSWEQFQVGWLPDNQIYCIEKAALNKSTISLTPMEREDKQTKMAIIKLSKTKAIVIESHGIDKWSSFNKNDRSYPGGFYGVMAYLVNTEDSVAPPVAADGRAIVDDTGNDPKYPRWAYWQKIDGPTSFLENFDYRSGTEPYNRYIATLGDTFTIEGVLIKLTGAGDFETIEITKL